VLDAANYFAVETLRNGRRLEIRALRPDDRDNYVAAVSHAGSQSLYRRFFGAKRHFTENEIRFFVNVDFVNHVALVAVAEEDGHPAIVGGGRYVVSAPGKGELAFMVVDGYQGQGIGAALLRHLTVIARAAGLREFTAGVLPSNNAMLKVFEKSGLRHNTKREAGSTHVTLQLS
jgi:RimJ/RimL family protein N-acetyltransferase